MKLFKSDTSWVLTFKHAFSGMAHLIKTEKSFRVHFSFAVAALLLLVIFQAALLEWVIILLVIGMVISSEILNTAIEIMVDIYCPFYHPLAKISKDVGAAAVLFSAIISIIIGLLIFMPYIITLFKSFY
ncbi:MAG: diacylglycerol kinase family protein [Anaerolineaceae bacterium]|nr:diacylglycerol kinase family protein [Anaerolineaceae bacterium]